MSILGGLYGRAASWRRAWYDRDPARRRRLAAPVISVGNLVIGGSGKTPTVAALVRVLQQQGERPVVLSRGYGRRRSSEAVVVVSDGTRVLVDTRRSGDEPQMLARALTGVPVLVARERYDAGAVAEQRFGATVHVLDDGFQHLPLARDVELLIVGRADLQERVLPLGRLREPLSVAGGADAVLVRGSDEDRAHVSARLGVSTVFALAIRYGDLPLRARRVVTVAGIARPERFFQAVRAQGAHIVRQFAFRDHHWFSRADVEEIERAAAEHDAIVVTTEKDAVRLDRVGWHVLPMSMSIEPEAAFRDWLTARLREARTRRGTAA